MDELFQAATLLATFDLGRDRYTVLKGYQHQIASCETEFAREARSLGVDGLLDNLYQYFLSYLQGVGDAAVLFQFGLDVSFLNGEEFLAVTHHLFQILLVGVELISQVKIMQEGHTFGTDIDKAGIESGHQFSDLCHVDVTHREGHRPLLLLVFHQLFVFEQRNRDVFRLNINDYFTCH